MTAEINTDHNALIGFLFHQLVYPRLERHLTIPLVEIKYYQNFKPDINYLLSKIAKKIC